MTMKGFVHLYKVLKIVWTGDWELAAPQQLGQVQIVTTLTYLKHQVWRMHQFSLHSVCTSIIYCTHLPLKFDFCFVATFLAYTLHWKFAKHYHILKRFAYFKQHFLHKKDQLFSYYFSDEWLSHFVNYLDLVKNLSMHMINRWI